MFFEVKEKFYKEFSVDEEKLAGLLRNAENANLVGEKAVKVALKEGLISKNSIKIIQSIPHVQIFKL